MKTALALTGFTVIWLAAWWAMRRDHTSRSTLQRALDAHRAYEADLNAILNRRHGPVYTCPYCDHDLEPEPFNFYCPRCRASVSNPQVAMEATDD